MSSSSFIITIIIISDDDDAHDDDDDDDNNDMKVNMILEVEWTTIQLFTSVLVASGYNLPTAKARGIYPLLVTSASVNNCYLFIYYYYYYYYYFKAATKIFIEIKYK